MLSAGAQTFLALVLGFRMTAFRASALTTGGVLESASFKKWHKAQTNSAEYNGIFIGMCALFYAASTGRGLEPSKLTNHACGLAAVSSYLFAAGVIVGNPPGNGGAQPNWLRVLGAVGRYAAMALMSFESFRLARRPQLKYQASPEQIATFLQDGHQLQSMDVKGYQKLERAPGPRLVVFTGSSDGSPTASWCPDCSRALPVVLESVLDNGLPLRVVGVGERDDWKLDARGSNHPFRAKSGLALSGIPTLLVIDKDGKEVAKLGAELENEEDQKVMRKLIDSTLQEKLGL